MRCVYCGRTATKKALVKRSLGYACPNWQACSKREAVRNARRVRA